MIKKVLSLFGREKTPELLFKDIHKCLDLFIAQEAKLWGSQLKNLKNEQEDALEDINHIIYKFQNYSEANMKKYLHSKHVEDIFKEILIIHDDLKVLKKLINRQEVFKNTLTSLTLMLVSEEMYQYFEDIFLLEKQLQEVLLWQEEEFNQIFKNYQDLKSFSNSEIKVDLMYEQLLKIRNILSGNLDHHDLWEDEMQGFSNCSNILHAIKAKMIQLENHYKLQKSFR